jgi:uncharacterized protein
MAVSRAAAGAAVTIQDQDTPVVDTANVLDAETRQRMVDLLHELKQKTGYQIKVLTVPSLGDEDVFSFAQRHYSLWKLGRKGKDDGALIVLAIKEHKVRIHTGYGLEGVLPDSWCGTASREVAQKYFARRQYAKGLDALAQAVVRRVADDAKTTIDALPARKADRGGDSDSLFTIFIIVFVIWFLISLYRSWRNRDGRRRWGQTAPGWGWNAFPTGSWGSGTGGGGGWSGGGSDFGGGGSSGGGGGGASW